MKNMDGQLEELKMINPDKQSSNESSTETEQITTGTTENDENCISSNDDDTTETSESKQELFKLPQTIKGPKLPPHGYSIQTSDNENISDTKPPEPSLQNESCGNQSNVKTESPSGKTSQDKTIPFPYKEPTWSGLSDQQYNMEVLKGGVIVDRIKLDTKPFYIVGRLSSCDIMLEHPSISRYHAVLQFRSVSDEAHPSGFYLYDLGSTHGTTLNKQPVQSRTYYRLRVGYMLKFGGSTRMFILQGPDNDQDVESNLSVTELKEMRKKQEEKLERLEKGDDDDDGSTKDKSETENEKDAGIDWGMGEDAVEEEEDESVPEENPFALDLIAPNEELYVDDPKKTLRGWFEREGYELEYQVEEKGYSQFFCRIQLPLDNSYGSPMFAEALIKGKKKEAVAACALEACRMLDRQGLLRQANHESRKRKLKNWEADDYYDSDEDTFLDRTGTIEKKRQQRIHRAGKDSQVVETYESLIMKLEQVNQEIQEIEQTMQASQKSKDAMNDENMDALEAYMSSISDDQTVDKCSRTALKVRLSQLRQEETKLKQLVEIARPTTLPELKPEPEKNSVFQKPGKPLPLIGSMKGRGIKTRFGAPPVKKPPTKIDTSATPIESVCSDEKNATLDAVDSASNESSVQNSEDNGNVTESVPSNDTSSTDQPENEAKQPSDSNMLPSKHKSRRKKYKSELHYVYDSANPDYAMWMPPENQSGDGRTSLNDKYGY